MILRPHGSFFLANLLDAQLSGHVPFIRILVLGMRSSRFPAFFLMTSFGYREIFSLYFCTQTIRCSNFIMSAICIIVIKLSAIIKDRVGTKKETNDDSTIFYSLLQTKEKSLTCRDSYTEILSLLFHAAIRCHLPHIVVSCHEKISVDTLQVTQIHSFLYFLIITLPIANHRGIILFSNAQ